MAFKLAYENVIIGLQGSFLFIDLFKIDRYAALFGILMKLPF